MPLCPAFPYPISHGRILEATRQLTIVVILTIMYLYDKYIIVRRGGNTWKSLSVATRVNQFMSR